MKAICKNCGEEKSSAAFPQNGGLCTGCKYLTPKQRERTGHLSAQERQEAIERKARNSRVGQKVEVAGMKLVRVDARGGNHQRFNFPAEQLELIRK